MIGYKYVFSLLGAFDVSTADEVDEVSTVSVGMSRISSLAENVNNCEIAVIIFV